MPLSLKDTNMFFFGLNTDQKERYTRIMKNYDFYEGYHWEHIPLGERDDSDIQITENYCAVFVDKYVAFEFGKAFYTRYSPFMEGKTVMDDSLASKDKDGKSRAALSDYMNQVWYNNDKEIFCIEFAKTKAITGEVWTYVQFISPQELDDPYGEFPQGKIKVSIMPTQYCFPTYNPDDTDILESLEIRYLVEDEDSRQYQGEFAVDNIKYNLKRIVYTKDSIVTYDNSNDEGTWEVNPYGIIPFVCTKNISNPGVLDGQDDLVNIIPLNVALDLAISDWAKILEYHASPVTVIYGAQAGNMEKGPNKTWSISNEKAKVENLEMRGNLKSTFDYVTDLKKSISGVACIPDAIMGGHQSISNTSGVALSYVNLPLIEKTNIKRLASQTGLEKINKMIIYISELENLITKPADVSRFDFMYNVVELPDTLPKDILLELQRIGEEMELGLLSREGALERLGEEDVPAVLESIAKDFEQNPVFYNSSFAIALLQQSMALSKATAAEGGSGTVQANLGRQSDMQAGSSINAGYNNGPNAQTRTRQGRRTGTGSG